MSDEEIEDAPPPVDEMLLLRLRDCATATRVGQIDRGFPAYMKRLAGMGYVKPIDDGHQVTEAGLEHLRQNRELLKRI